MNIDLSAHGYDEVPAVLQGEFPKLPPDGYICKVFNTEITKSKAGNLMLVLSIDIAEGDFQGHFLNAIKRVHSSDIKWDSSAIYRQLIFDNNNKISRFFKGLLTCFELSNPNFHVNLKAFDPAILRGLIIGFIFAEEEYEKRDGSISTRIFPKFPATVDKIRNHDFSVPELRKLSKPAPIQSNDSFDGEPVPTFDIPF